MDQYGMACTYNGILLSLKRKEATNYVNYRHANESHVLFDFYHLVGQCLRWLS